MPEYCIIYRTHGGNSVGVKCVPSSIPACRGALLVSSLPAHILILKVASELGFYLEEEEEDVNEGKVYPEEMDNEQMSDEEMNEEQMN